MSGITCCLSPLCAIPGLRLIGALRLRPNFNPISPFPSILFCLPFQPGSVAARSFCSRNLPLGIHLPGTYGHDFVDVAVFAHPPDQAAECQSGKGPRVLGLDGSPYSFRACDVSSPSRFWYCRLQQRYDVIVVTPLLPMKHRPDGT